MIEDFAKPCCSSQKSILDHNDNDDATSILLYSHSPDGDSVLTVMRIALWRRDAVYFVGVFLGFFSGRRRPAAGNDVVGRALWFSRDEVEWNGGEHPDTSAL